MEEFYHANARTDVLPHIPRKCGKVLDVGGGVGATSSILKREGRATQVVVADMEQGKPLAGVDEIVCGDLDDPKTLDRIAAEHGPFDTILCLDVLEHLKDPWATMDKLSTMLSPGGVVVSSIPNVNFITLVAPLVVKGRFDYQDSGILDHTHIRWFTEGSAKSLMSRSGLKIEQVVGSIPSGKPRLADRLTLGRLRRFFVLQYIIRATKTGTSE